MNLLINTDGSAQGSPGPSGIGVVIREPGENGPTLLEEISEGIGYANNNQAEYRAVIRALQRAQELKATTVEVRSDSLLLVRQVNGAWSITSDELQSLWREVIRLARSFESCTFIHVYRTENTDADLLAGKASRREKGKRA